MGVRFDDHYSAGHDPDGDDNPACHDPARDHASTDHDSGDDNPAGHDPASDHDPVGHDNPGAECDECCRGGDGDGVVGEHGGWADRGEGG